MGSTPDGIEQIKQYKSAYEKMLEDGSAFKEVDLNMHTEPDINLAQGSGEPTQPLSENPMGERIVEDENVDFTEFDNAMQKRMDALRNKMKGVKKSGGTSTNPQQEIISLKKRVKKLEEALILVMKTHEKLL